MTTLTEGISLSVPSTEDLRFLRTVELNDTNRGSWRFRGSTPSPEQYLEQVWDGTLCQFIVVASNPTRPIGFVQCYNAQFRDGHASVSLLAFADDLVARTQFLIGVAQFLGEVFREFPFRKVYFEVSGFNVDRMSGVIKLLMHEGSLAEHTFRDGRYWPLEIFSITREELHRHLTRLAMI